MRLRGAFFILLITAAMIAATCKVSHAQTGAVNPSSLEFSSQDHAATLSYRICFYPSATATTPARCNDVPVAAATSQGNGVYRVPRSAWSTGLALNTDYFPKVRAVGSDSTSAGEVGPTVAPFSFKLLLRDVTGVTLVP